MGLVGQVFFHKNFGSIVLDLDQEHQEECLEDISHHRVFTPKDKTFLFV